MKEEYLMLRDEILHLDNVVNNTINFFYVFMATYSAFSLTQDDTIFILLSYIVIIPAYLIVLNKMQGVCKIGAYLKVFHEGNCFNWETRHMKYKDKNESSRFRIISWHFPFILVTIAVSILFLFKTSWSDVTLYDKFKIGMFLLATGSVFYNVIKYRNISPKDYFDKWLEIKNLFDN